MGSIFDWFLIYFNGSLDLSNFVYAYQLIGVCLDFVLACFVAD